MSEHRFMPSPEEVLGKEFVDEWNAKTEDLDRRAADIDLDVLLPAEELADLRAGLAEVGINDIDLFLKRNVITFLEFELDDPRNESGFVGYINNFIGTLQSGNTYI